MEVEYSPNALEDINFWKGKHDDKTLQRIRKLIENIQEISENRITIHSVRDHY